MKIRDIREGMAVRVTRGYSTRPAIVTAVLHSAGKVAVSFTDIDRNDPAVRRIAGTNRSYLFGATVRPNQVTPK